MSTACLLAPNLSCIGKSGKRNQLHPFSVGTNRPANGKWAVRELLHTEISYTVQWVSAILF